MPVSPRSREFRSLVLDYGRLVDQWVISLAAHYGVALDVAIHSPQWWVCARFRQAQRQRSTTHEGVDAGALTAQGSREAVCRYLDQVFLFQHEAGRLDLWRNVVRAQ